MQQNAPPAQFYPSTREPKWTEFSVRFGTIGHDTEHFIPDTEIHSTPSRRFLCPSPQGTTDDGGTAMLPRNQTPQFGLPPFDTNLSPLASVIAEENVSVDGDNQNGNEERSKSQNTAVSSRLLRSGRVRLPPATTTQQTLESLLENVTIIVRDLNENNDKYMCADEYKELMLIAAEQNEKLNGQMIMMKQCDDATVKNYKQ